MLSKRLVRWPRAKTVLPLILLALIPLEHARRNVYARIPTEDEIPAVYHWLAELPEDFPVVEFPVYDRRFLRFYGYETYFSTVHWKRVPFGKPSFKPPAMEYMLWTWRDFPSSEGTRLLQSLGVRYIIYHPRRDPNAARVNRRLRQDPNFEFVRQFPRAMRIARRLRYGEEMVFRVLPASEPLSPPPQVEERLRAIPRDAWEFKTSSQSDARLAVDGSLETSWSSGKGQEKGQFFEIDLEGEYRVSKISLGFSFPYGHFPRSLAVNGFHPSHRWRRLELEEDPWQSARLVRRLVENPKEATMDVVLREPQLLERLRLFIREADPSDVGPVWRIPEVQVFEALPHHR